MSVQVGASGTSIRRTSDYAYVKHSAIIQLGHIRDFGIDADIFIDPKVLMAIFVEQRRYPEREIAGWGYIDDNNMFSWIALLSAGEQASVHTTPQDMAWSMSKCLESTGNTLNVQFHTHGDNMAAFYSATDQSDIKMHLDDMIDMLTEGVYWAVIAGQGLRDWVTRKYIWKDKKVYYNEGTLFIDNVKIAYKGTTSYNGYRGTNYNGTGEWDGKTGEWTTKTTKQSAPTQPKLLPQSDPKVIEMNSTGHLVSASVSAIAGKIAPKEDTVRKWIGKLSNFGIEQVLIALGAMYQERAEVVVKYALLNQATFSTNTPMIQYLTEQYKLSSGLKVVNALGSSTWATYISTLATLKTTKPTAMLYDLLTREEKSVLFPSLAQELYAAIFSKNKTAQKALASVVSDVEEQFIAYAIDHNMHEIVPFLADVYPDTFNSIAPYEVVLWADLLTHTSNTVDLELLSELAVAELSGLQILSLFLCIRDYRREKIISETLHRVASNRSPGALTKEAELSIADDLTGAVIGTPGSDMKPALAVLRTLKYGDATAVYNIFFEREKTKAPHGKLMWDFISATLSGMLFVDVLSRIDLAIASSMESVELDRVIRTIDEWNSLEKYNTLVTEFAIGNEYEFDIERTEEITIDATIEQIKDGIRGEATEQTELITTD